jgi:lipopolysaccharide heptosyltransferase II
MSSATLRKILLIRLSSIGDIILTTPLLRVLKARYPECEVHYITRKEFSELLRDDPLVDRLISIDVAGGRSAMRALNLELMEQRYDAVLDLHNNFRSRILRNGLSSRLHVVDKRSLRRLLLTQLHVNTFGEITPVPERYIETARRYGIHSDALGPRLHPTEAQRASARIKLREAGADLVEYSIGLCPGAMHFTKRWPEEYFVELARLLTTRGERLLLFGGSQDNAIAEAIRRTAPPSINDLTGRLSLMETAAAMERCRVIVANDSGLMHMATAVQRPVIAIFGNTVREFGFFPYNSPAVILETNGLRCRPCSHIGLPNCPKQHFACMREIQAAQVVEAVDALAPPV